jgi:hypothetical protein
MENEMSPSPTISEFNAKNRLFWEEQNALRDRRIADEAIRETAFSRLASEQVRGLPVYYQTPIEKLLADAEGDKQRFLYDQAHKGGQAKKSDPLQQAIESLVRRDPHITSAKVRAMLTRERYPELIEDVDEEEISFVWFDRSGRRRSKQAAISGLKHRLSRAKRTSR